MTYLIRNNKTALYVARYGLGDQHGNSRSAYTNKPQMAQQHGTLEAAKRFCVGPHETPVAYDGR